MTEKKISIIDLTVPSDSEVSDVEDIYSDEDSIVVSDEDELIFEDEVEDEPIVDEETQWETTGISLHFTNCTFNLCE